MNRKELISAIAERAGLTKKDAEKALSALTDTITEELKNGNKISLVGFGTFEVKERAARIGHNPSTGEKLEIPSAKVPSFKPGKSLKDAVNA